MPAPTDPLYARQWHLPMLGNIERIWEEFTGRNVSVGIFEGLIQATHEDLAANYDPSQVPTGQAFDNFLDPHTTAVAGLIAAARNDIGAVGVAYDASLAGVPFYRLTDEQPVIDTAPASYFAYMARFDVVNNSWGYFPDFRPFQDLSRAGSSFAQRDAAMADVVSEGRGGLGTIIVHAAGNDNLNANGEAFSLSRYTISVGAVAQNGFITDYSSYGHGLLVSAPAASYTTDLMGDDGYNSQDFGGSNPEEIDLHPDVNYTSQFGGTSASAPVTSGVVALMLDAAPGLGWRDVQTILALSAAHTGSPADGTSQTANEDSPWMTLSGKTWNGGGQIFSESMAMAWSTPMRPSGWPRPG